MRNRNFNNLYRIVSDIFNCKLISYKHTYGMSDNLLYSRGIQVELIKMNTNFLMIICDNAPIFFN